MCKLLLSKREDIWGGYIQNSWLTSNVWSILTIAINWRGVPRAVYALGRLKRHPPCPWTTEKDPVIGVSSQAYATLRSFDQSRFN